MHFPWQRHPGCAVLLETDGVMYRWQQVSGPASMTLTQAEQLNSTASFSERGVYELLLRAEKAGQLWNSIAVIITVHQRPVLDVGTDQLITLPANTVTLPRTTAVKDSGLGNRSTQAAMGSRAEHADSRIAK